MTGMKHNSVKAYKRMIKGCTLAVAFFLGICAGAAHAEEIQSRSALVMDSATGRVLYAKNPDLRLMPASTTKLMTALVVIENARLSDVVRISQNAANTAPTKTRLKAGDLVKIETLLYAALMKSANDAAVALAEAVAGTEEEFVVLMNRKALAIGAHDTRFVNASGLPGSGQHITSYDLGKIMRHAIKYPILKEILGTRITELSTENGKTLFIKNTNKLLWSDEELLGGKTGYTRQARHCFVSAGERDTGTIIVALLGTPARDLLWKETEQLLAFGAKVLGNTEEPVIYFTKSDYESSRIQRVSYSKKTKTRAKQKIGNTKKVSSKKKGISAKKKSAAKGIAKKKSSSRSTAKKKSIPKRSDVVRQGGNGTQG